MRNIFKRRIPPPSVEAPPVGEAEAALREARVRRDEAARKLATRSRIVDPIVADIIDNLIAKGADTR